jgi:hypothetical protein
MAGPNVPQTSRIIKNMSLISVQHPRIEAGSRCHLKPLHPRNAAALLVWSAGYGSPAALKFENVSPLSRSAAKAGLGSVETSISSNLCSMISWISDDFY